MPSFDIMSEVDQPSLRNAIEVTNSKITGRHDFKGTSAKVEHAEWLLSIATIHHEANLTFARTGRAEPTPDQWRKLRNCESTEVYEIDTGNTFYGAYQFTWQTWGTVGVSDNIIDASWQALRDSVEFKLLRREMAARKKG